MCYCFQRGGGVLPTAWNGLSSSLVLLAPFFHLRTSPVSDTHKSQPSYGCTYRSLTKSGGTFRQTSCRRSGRSKCCLQLSLALTPPGHGSDCGFSFRLKPPANKFSTGSQQHTHDRSSPNANGDRRRGDCCQEFNARSSQAHANHRKRSVNSVGWLVVLGLTAL